MRRLICAAAAALLCTVALAANPHFISATFSTHALQDQALTISAREVGLGHAASTQIQATAHVYTKYRCGRRGEVEVQVRSVTAYASPKVVNGQVRVEFPLYVPESNLTCKNPNRVPKLKAAVFGPVLVIDAGTGARAYADATALSETDDLEVPDADLDGTEVE